MVVAYWIVAGLQGLLYLFAGGKKVVQSREKLAPTMGWVDTVSMPVVRFVGAVEILGVAGLILPPLTGIVPALAIAAAVGFAVLQILAARLHLSRGETKESTMNVVLIVLAAVTAWLATAF